MYPFYEYLARHTPIDTPQAAAAHYISEVKIYLKPKYPKLLRIIGYLILNLSKRILSDVISNQYYKINFGWRPLMLMSNEITKQFENEQNNEILPND
jgi:hypothetical protein